MPNPWLSFWLSAANAWAGAARGFWTAEMHRQQAAMMNEMARQMMRFWTQPRPVPTRSAKRARRR